jgi:hypothetical protein
MNPYLKNVENNLVPPGILFLDIAESNLAKIAKIIWKNLVPKFPNFLATFILLSSSTKHNGIQQE